jgi:hypothetical protein
MTIREDPVNGSPHPGPAVVDILGPPPVDVQEQAVGCGAGPVRERAGGWGVVVRAVDASLQPLLIAVHLISVAAATDNAGVPRTALADPQLQPRHGRVRSASGGASRQPSLR